MKPFVFVALLSIVVVGCQVAEKKNTDIFTISIDPFDKTTHPISEIATDIEYTVLETADSFLVAYPAKIVEYKQLLYILDNNMFASVWNNSLFVFDKQGNFIRKIGEKGNGPGEYLNAQTMEIYNDTLFFYDNQGGKIIYYDLLGNYLSELSVPNHSMYAFGRVNNLWVSYSNSPSPEMLNTIRKNTVDGKLTQSDLESCNDLYAIHLFTPTISTYTSSRFHIRNLINWEQISPFYSFNNSLIFTHGFNDTIYTITEKEISPRYYIDFGKYKVPEEACEKNPLDFANKYMRDADEDYAGILDCIYENNQYVGFSFWSQDSCHSAIYSKKMNKSYTVNQFVNDINGGPLKHTNYLTSWMTMQNNEIVGVVFAEDFIAHCQANKGSLSDEVQKIVEKITPFSNPILIKIKLK